MSNSDELINGLSFEEKLTNLNIIHPESGLPMSTVTTLDEFPGSFYLGVDVDLFNIKADHKYQIRVYIKDFWYSIIVMKFKNQLIITWFFWSH